MIELFVKSEDIVLKPTDTESLSHPCVGPQGQLAAAADTSSIKGFLPFKHREALEKTRKIAAVKKEELVIWDVSTLKGRIRAWKYKIKETPSVVFNGKKLSSLKELDQLIAKE